MLKVWGVWEETPKKSSWCKATEDVEDIIKRKEEEEYYWYHVMKTKKNVFRKILTVL